MSAGQNVYYVTTLTPNPATITLTGMSDDADLFVYTDPAFTAQVCASTMFGSADETCNFAVGATASYYIRVRGFTGSTSYNLNVNNP
ncbi:MAG: PPC domain-containing protein [SAR324 cluster bacterium]|nr:PPC domain-containing protein [SAR324 cluster bacterium]